MIPLDNPAGSCPSTGTRPGSDPLDVAAPVPVHAAPGDPGGPPSPARSGGGGGTSSPPRDRERTVAGKPDPVPGVAAPANQAAAPGRGRLEASAHCIGSCGWTAGPGPAGDVDRAAEKHVRTGHPTATVAGLRGAA
jgi:hypothetical protein